MKLSWIRLLANYHSLVSSAAMERALVTGGFGFLGSEIARQLVDEGVRVRVMAMPGEPRDNLAGVDVEVIEGNVLSTDDCKRAVQGCEVVFHAAAVYSDWAPDPTLMYNVNHRGTFHVIEASRQAGVKTVVYTASIVSVGRPPAGQLADESTAYEAWDIDFPYSRSKFFSREIAEYFTDWGYDVRSVLPGLVFGPGDIRPTPSGQLIINSLSGLPATYFDGGTSYVDVRDAARVHLLAVQKGKPGERYLATAHNISNKDMIETIDRAVGKKRRLVKLPTPLARAMATAFEIQARRTGKAPLLARDFLEYSLKANYFSNRKTVDQLGASFRPIDETIKDAIAYFRERGMV